jgi:hypothetical protein
LGEHRACREFLSSSNTWIQSVKISVATMHKGEQRVSLCVDALVVNKGTILFACNTDRTAIAWDVTYENVETDCMNHKIRARRMLSLKMTMARMGQDKHGH